MPKTLSRKNRLVTSEAHLVRMLLQCGAFLHREINRLLAPLSVKLPQFMALNAIVCNGPLSQKHLTTQLLLEKANISKIIQILLKDELIKVTTAPADRRMTLLTETPQGYDLWKKASQQFDELSKALTCEIDRNEILQTGRCLKKLQTSYKRHET
jgi:DNA-binding MarR family transcriptional regulator